MAIEAALGIEVDRVAEEDEEEEEEEEEEDDEDDDQTAGWAAGNRSCCTFKAPMLLRISEAHVGQLVHAFSSGLRCCANNL